MSGKKNNFTSVLLHKHAHALCTLHSTVEIPTRARSKNTVVVSISL